MINVSLSFYNSDEAKKFAEFFAGIEADRAAKYAAEQAQFLAETGKQAQVGGFADVMGASVHAPTRLEEAASAKAPTIVNEPKASVFTEEDVANATRELAQKKGIDAASALLKSFEIARARDLPVEKRTQYIEQAKALQAVTE